MRADVPASAAMLLLSPRESSVDLTTRWLLTAMCGAVLMDPGSQPDLEGGHIELTPLFVLGRTESQLRQVGSKAKVLTDGTWGGHFCCNQQLLRCKSVSKACPSSILGPAHAYSFTRL